MDLNNTPADALARLRSFYASLSPSEQKVGEYILENSAHVIRMTLAEIAEQSGVSDATALRLCRSLGYEGWLEFKIALTRAIPSSPQLIYDDIKQEDAPGLLAQKVLRGSIQALEDTLAVLDIQAFQRAIDLLAGAKRIMIVGVGTSGPLAHELFNRLFRLGLQCWVQTDSYLQVMQTALWGAGDVLVIISQTGASTDPLRTASEAKAHQVPIIAITGNVLSPLGQLVDITLLSVSHETRSETIASRVAQYALIHAIYVALAVRSMDTTIQTEHTIWEALMRRQLFQSGS